MNEVGTGKNSFILIEGILEKLKEREFLWIFSGKKFSATWVLRYYVLRCANIPGAEAFLLEQHEDCMPFSKVRKTLDLRRVLQIDTNISLKIGKQDWILAIHYKAKHDGRLKILYLAAHSETEMNMWIMKLCYARKFQKQDVYRENNVDESGNEFSIVTSCMNNRCFSDSSLVESPTLSNNTNNTNYIDSMTTDAYIHLKDCSSTHSLRSSSASLSSSIPSLSTVVDYSLFHNVSFKNSFLIPPPIPPKPSHSLRIQRGNFFESDRYISNQSLISTDIHEVPNVKEKEWNNEIVHPNKINLIGIDKTSLSFDSSSISSVSDSSAPKPLPRRRNFRNIPPKVDRSCKPTSIRYIAINNNQKRKREAFEATSRFSLTNPSHQQSLYPMLLRNKQILVHQKALYDNESVRTVNTALDYLDPVKEPLVQSQLFMKCSQRSKICCATEYTQIDEESTKAVLEANVRQNEMRRNGFSV